MINEEIKCVYYPVREDGWFIVETGRALYELRLGGYRAIARFEEGSYRVVNRFDAGISVMAAFTDDESLYLVLSNGEHLCHGFTSINTFGDMSASVQMLTRDQFYRIYGDSFFSEHGVRQLKTDPQGNSL